MMNWLRLVIARIMWARQVNLGGLGGRHVDWTPAECMKCGWQGPVRWLRHDYQDDGAGDVEPADYCPRCGSYDVEEYYDC
jgi:hypothetical protein